MPAIFEPPTYLEGPRVTARPHPGNRLMRFYRPRPVGHSVWKLEGAWHEGAYPEARVTNDAEHFFLGGHIFIVDNTLAAELEANGFNVVYIGADEDEVVGGPSSPEAEDFIFGGDAFTTNDNFLFGGDAGDFVIYLGGDAYSTSSEFFFGGTAESGTDNFISGGDS